MFRTKSLLAATVLTAGLATLSAPSMAGASTSVTTTRSYGVIHCNTVRCSQRRTVTTYRHGSAPLVKVQIHYRPVESRTADHGQNAWGRWETIGVS